MIVLIPILLRVRKLRNKYRIELSEQNEKLEHINKQLKKDNEELVKANHLLDTFISVFAHDLINPFQAIIGFSELMSTNRATLKKEDYIEYSELLSETSFQLNQLLTNLKSLSIIQDDQLKLEPSRVLISSIIDKVLILFEPSARKKEIVFKVHGKENDCYAYINPEIIESALRNLISNAVKFSNTGSNIDIEYWQKAKEIVLSVQDYGSGIPEKVLKRLYDKKQTYSTSGTANEKGSGIGLAISIELLESFNGSIEFESKIGEGCKAIIKIPASNE